jgi:hypothetical protein
MSEKKNYRAGALIHIEDSDPWFETYDQALSHAEKLESESPAWESGAYAVWDREGGCLCIVFEGWTYSRD